MEAEFGLNRLKMESTSISVSRMERAIQEKLNNQDTIQQPMGSSLKIVNESLE